MFRWASRSTSLTGSRSGARWSGVRDALVRTVLVVEGLELAQRVPQMALVPDQGAVELPIAVGNNRGPAETMDHTAITPRSTMDDLQSQPGCNFARQSLD
jgi:hypothetical protein